MRRPDVDLETQLAEADTRRREMEQQRIQKLSLISGADKIEKVRHLSNSTVSQCQCHSVIIS